MSNSRPIAKVLVFQQLKNELAPEIADEIFQIDVYNEVRTLDTVVVVQRKRDKAYIKLDFHPTQVQHWEASQQVCLKLDDTTRAKLILFLG